jgi:hypothetical protein
MQDQLLDKSLNSDIIDLYGYFFEHNIYNNLLDKSLDKSLVNSNIILMYYCLCKQCSLSEDVFRVILSFYYNARHREIDNILIKKFRQSRNKYSLKWNSYLQPVILLTSKKHIYEHTIGYLKNKSISFKDTFKSKKFCYYGRDGDCCDPECDYLTTVTNYEIIIS